MKKFLCTLILGMVAAIFCRPSQAQSNSYKLDVDVFDQYNQFVSDSILLSFRNSDSSTTSTNPYTSISRLDYVSSVYDSGSVANNYTDSLITIQYKACGQWYTLDTFFNVYHYSSLNIWYLSADIHVPCTNPCNADFYHGVSQHQLMISADPIVYFGPFTYHWYFGDGHDAFTENTLHTYATPGTYTLSLVILDTLNACKDSVAKSITISPQCFPAFYANHKQYGNVDIIAGNNVHPGFRHTWIIGDSVFSNNGASFSFRFGAGGFKPIKHIVEFPGYCKDSLSKYPTNSGCQTEIAGHQVNYRNVTIQPVNNVDTFRYDFGNGTIIIARGQVSYTYNSNATYQVKIRDLHGYCYQKIISVTTTLNCGAYFGSQVDSLFNMRFFSTQASNYTIRRVIYPLGDTLYGDTVSYSFPSRGNYGVIHELTDSLGNQYCYFIENVFVSSCGLFGWANMKDFIRGEVRFNSNSNTSYDSLVVYLIEHDSVAGTLTAIDSVPLHSSPNDSGYFEFFHLCDTNKKYLVKAALLPGSGIYSNFLPTYFNQNASWSGASKIAAGNFIVLNMLAGTNPGGPGFIGGYISQGANKKFKPLEGIQITLFDDNDTPIAFDLSNADGYYEFPSLPYGTYRVTVEIMGKPSDSYMITLSATNEKAEGQDFEVNSTYISTLNTAIHMPNIAGRIYPNPAKEQLMIEWTEQAGTDITLRFYSMHGQLIREFSIDRKDETTSTLDIREFPRGIYMLQIESGSGQSIYRIHLQ